MATELGGLVRIPANVPATRKDWDQLFRLLNQNFKIDADQRRVIVDALTTIADRTGTDISTILGRISDDGKAEDQRFLPQVSAGNVLSLQNVNPLIASSDSTTATISVSAHTLQYGFGAVTYNSGTVLGLNPATNYYVYADDPDYEGGAVSYFATINRQNVTASNGRYFVGAIVTAISANTAAITAASSANPIVFTTGTMPGWGSGNTVTLSALPGDFGTNLNGNDYVITVLSPTTFSIPVNGTLYIAYTTGGLASRVSEDLSGGAGGGGGWVDNRYYSP